MPTPLSQKSSLSEIRNRFDQDVERFSNLDTGQSATIDAPLAMELISLAATHSTPHLQRVLDIGCGAGNNTLKLRQTLGRDFAVDLLDLSQPMLTRAQQRVAEINKGPIQTICQDFRTAPLTPNSYDVILAAAVLHHLRDDHDWLAAFQKLFLLTAPGGSLWITDLVSHQSPPIQQLMWNRYGQYLSSLAGDDYRQKVFDYIDREDSPRPLTYQLNLLQSVGFTHIDILHKNSCFAAFGAQKPPTP